jgi:hypothetical protein
LETVCCDLQSLEDSEVRIVEFVLFGDDELELLANDMTDGEAFSVEASG